MFNVCPQCASYQIDKEIIRNETQSFAVCRDCQYEHSFLQQPLYCITGASGAGKSTICYVLTKRLQNFVVLEKDILWADVFNDPTMNFNEIWMRMAKNIGQSGKPVVLCGTTLPQHLDNSIEKRYFSTIRFLALVCDDDVLAERLRQRPAWRGFNDESIAEHVSFNQWIKENYSTRNLPMDLLDTSHRSVEDCAEEVERWVNSF